MTPSILASLMLLVTPLSIQGSPSFALVAQPSQKQQSSEPKLQRMTPKLQTFHFQASLPDRRSLSYVPQSWKCLKSSFELCMWICPEKLFYSCGSPPIFPPATSFAWNLPPFILRSPVDHAWGSLFERGHASSPRGQRHPARHGQNGHSQGGLELRKENGARSRGLQALARDPEGAQGKRRHACT